MHSRNTEHGCVSVCVCASACLQKYNNFFPIHFAVLLHSFAWQMLWKVLCARMSRRADKCVFKDNVKLEGFPRGKSFWASSIPIFRCTLHQLDTHYYIFFGFIWFGEMAKDFIDFVWASSHCTYSSLPRIAWGWSIMNSYVYLGRL